MPTHDATSSPMTQAITLPQWSFIVLPVPALIDANSIDHLCKPLGVPLVKPGFH